mgnify:CR=1 FL=1
MEKDEKVFIAGSGGLVGSAIGHHPELRLLLERLVGTGRQVSLSSIRADRLDDCQPRTR